MIGGKGQILAIEDLSLISNMPIPEEKADFSDEDLDRMFKLIKSPIHEERDQNVARARAALDMIDRVSAHAQSETVESDENTIAENTVFEEAVLPETIGRFRIDSVVGKGGFGIVFKASDPNLERLIALKIPRPEAVLTKELKQRFVSEGRAAAALAHHNIVPVFESGQTGSICYLACELVEGQTLEAWASAQDKLKIQDIVVIGQALSDAIAHAHQRGVMHRDIKPSNVLISSELDQPLQARIKITDFGLAKNLNEDAGQTQTGALIGTPFFMATEQAKQKPATTSSDIYSIGAVIYWLMTGEPPFKGNGIFETIQSIIKEEPVAPRSIRADVPRDLESICLRCLEKQPAARYKNANELYADLGRFKNGEPVQARTITPTILLSRWIGRNRIVTCLLLLLAVGVVTSVMGLIKARRAEIKIRESAEIAKLAEAQAREGEQTALEVADYLVSIFRISKNDTKTASEVTALEILNRGAKEIRGELEDQPKVQVRLMKTMGEAFLNLGQYPESIEILGAAIEINKTIDPKDVIQQAEIRSLLGRVLQLNDQTEESIVHLETAIGHFITDEENQLEQLANAHNRLAIAFKKTDLNKSIASLELARLYSYRNDPESRGVWQLDANIANMYYHTGDYEKSLENFEKALEGGVDVLGRDHQRIGIVVANMGALQRKLGNLQEGLKLNLHSLEIAIANLPEDHPNIGVAQIGVGNSYKSVGRLELAKKHELEAMRILEAKLVENHSDCMTVRSNLALTLMLLREFDSAEKLYLKSQSVATDPVVLLNLDVFLADLDLTTGKLDSAERRMAALMENSELSKYPMLESQLRLLQAQRLAQMKDDRGFEALESAIEFSRKSGVSQANLFRAEARFWAWFGDEEKCLENLESAVKLGQRTMRILAKEYDLIRSQKRYMAIESYMLDLTNEN